MSYNTVGIIKNGVKQKLPVVMVAPKVDGPDYVEVVADGVKTYSQLLSTLYGLADTSKISEKSILRVNNNICPCIEINGSDYYFGRSFAGSTVKAEMMMFRLGTTCTRITWLFNTTGNTPYDESSETVPSGRVITLYYDSATLDLTTRASNCVYDNSNSGLSATDTQGAIDEVVAKVDRGSVSVTADGVKTYGTLLNELQALVDYTKVTDYTYLKMGTVVMRTTVVNTSGNTLAGGSVSLNGTPPHLFAHLFLLSTNDSHYYWADGSTSTTDRTSSTASNGTVIKLVY